MKRLFTRISVLAGLLAIGWIAIAQAQRGDDHSSPKGESEISLTVSDQIPEKQEKNKLGSDTKLPPLKLSAKPFTAKTVTPKRLPPKPLKIESVPTRPAPVTQLTPPPLLPSRSNPLRKPKAKELPNNSLATSSVQLASNDAHVPGNFGMKDRTTSTPPPAHDAPPVLSPIVPEAPRPLNSNQAMASPIKMPNRSPNELDTTTPDRPISDNRPTPKQTLNSKPSDQFPANNQYAFPKPKTNPPAKIDPFPNGPGIPSRLETPARTPVVRAEGTGTPATDRRLDGAQTPQLTIEKFAPPEIQVGNPVSFRVVVRNTGTIVAHGVEVRDQVPKGTRLEATHPRASRGVRGELVWDLGDIKPGEERTVEAKLMPLAEGEIGSVATVHFKANASVRTRATKPELVIQTSMPQSVLIGEDVKLEITVSNPGSGIARGVVIQEKVPAGLQHPAGAELEYEIGDLEPNQSRSIELTLTAARAGRVTNVLVARAKSGLQSTDKIPLEVIAPQLQLAIHGPGKRFLERKTTYKLSVSNPGTAPARDVRLQAKLPEGMRFVNANNHGHYDQQSNTVVWALAELPVNETGNVLLTAMPEKIGEQKLTYRGTAEGALSVEEQKAIYVDGIAAIRFEVVDVEDPIEVGGETLYEIRVVNQGSKASTNIRMQVTLPISMQLLNAEGPGDIRSNVDRDRVTFEPLRRLSPKVDTTYRIRVKCNEAGDQRIRVQLQTDDMQSPVTKEESTRVFSDR